MARSDNYRPRVVDTILTNKLEGAGAVLIEGAKWCGKTTTASQHSRSEIFMDQPGFSQSYVEIAAIDPNLILTGETPRLIDEWQIAPSLWDAVRHTVDRRNKDGQFILTGSAVPLSLHDENSRTHTGTGRISRLRMRPMSLWESGDSNGKVSLKELFNRQAPSAECSIDLEQIVYLVCRGGWPRAVGQRKEVALDRAFDYFDAVVNADISRADGVTRNPDRTAKIMRSYARMQGAQTSISAIRDDIAANGNDSIDDRTVQAYINALKLIFVVEDMPAWNPNLRSKSAIRSSDTRYFVDPSIAVASLGIGPVDLLNDLNTLGLIFETLCVRDLRVYAESLKGSVYHYRDSAGLECDAVVHLRDGRYGLIEIKLGGDKAIDEGAANLLKLRGKIDTDKMKEPTFMMVLIAVGKFAYRRSDGVFVVPITTLKD